MNIENTIAYCGLICELCRPDGSCNCKTENCCGKRLSPNGCYQYNCCTEKKIAGCWECEQSPCGIDMMAPEKIKLRAFVRCIKEDGIEAFYQYIENNNKNGIVYHRNGVFGDYDLDTEDEVLFLLRNGKNRPHGIIVFGANGSGKTTLARELAKTLNFKHMDIEDYYFEKSDIPYTVARSEDECLNLTLADINKYGSFVLSAVTGDFGDIIPQFYDLAVFISAPLELRLKRIDQRQIERFGDRVLDGGDMCSQSQSFMKFVATRSTSKIDEWAKTLTCPVIYVNGTEDWRINAKSVSEQFLKDV